MDAKLNGFTVVYISQTPRALCVNTDCHFKFYLMPVILSWFVIWCTLEKQMLVLTFCIPLRALTNFTDGQLGFIKVHVIFQYTLV